MGVNNSCISKYTADKLIIVSVFPTFVVIFLGLWKIFTIYIYFWVNYSELTPFLNPGIIGYIFIWGMIPKWSYFSLVKYDNLPRLYYLLLVCLRVIDSVGFHVYN